MTAGPPPEGDGTDFLGKFCAEALALGWVRRYACWLEDDDERASVIELKV